MTHDTIWRFFERLRIAPRSDRAPMVREGARDGTDFPAYVRAFLVPTLQPGDIVIVDNLKAHKVGGLREAIEAAGADPCF